MKTFQNVECIRCGVVECLTQTHKKGKRKWKKKLDDHPCFNCGFPVWESWLLWQTNPLPIDIENRIKKVMNNQVMRWMGEVV
jgi:hypothetical protein